MGPDQRAPFLAILPRVLGFEGIQLPGTVQYRIRMLSQPASLDTIVRVAPGDTVILGGLTPATYEVRAAGWPERCNFQDGVAQRVIVYEGLTTSLVRYRIGCTPSLTVSLDLEGKPPGDSVWLSLRRPDGTADLPRRVGLRDTLRIDGLDPGTYQVGYTFLAGNCFPLTPGGRYSVPVEVTAAGGVRTTLRFHCAPAGVSPRVESLEASFADGLVGFTLRAIDPDRNLDRYGFNLTDCQGRALFSFSERIRNGFLPAVGPSADTSMATVAFPVDLRQEELATRCVAARVIDRDGNSSSIIERRIRVPSPQRSPVITYFNAFFPSVSQLNVSSFVEDPDGDYAGVFVLLTFRDGALTGRLDGLPDEAVLNTVGFPGGFVPPILAGGSQPTFEKFVRVRVAFLDRAGNVVVRTDEDLLR